MTTTPKTDAAAFYGGYIKREYPVVTASFSRKLETERDRLLADNNALREACESLLLALGDKKWAAVQQARAALDKARHD